MLKTLRNITVNIIAAFMGDKNARQRFRKKYKVKSNYRKLKDDNAKLFKENMAIRQEINEISQHLLKIDSKLFAISNSSTDRKRVYLSIVCMALNEGPYIKEWIEYHKLVGVERFYFYDNGSNDNTREILEPYIRGGGGSIYSS